MEFFKNDKKNSPESTAIWEWIKNNPPAISWDIHAYIYQADKQARPYIPSIINYNKNLRWPAWKLFRSVIKLCKNQAATGKTAETEDSFSIHMIRNYGTLVLTGYHFHFADGPDKSKEFIINSLRTILKSLSYIPSINNLKKQKNASNDFFKNIWKTFELIFDRLPRKIFKYFDINKNNRSAIDSSKRWKKYNFKEDDKKTVATVSSDLIN